MSKIIWESNAQRNNGNPIITIEQSKDKYLIQECSYSGEEYKTWRSYANYDDAFCNALSRALRYTP